MKSSRLLPVVLAAFALFASACSESTTTPEKRTAMGMISGIGGFHDGFNLSCRQGLLDAVRDFPVDAEFREWMAPTPYDSALAWFAHRPCDLLYLVAPMDMAKVAAFAGAHPAMRFVVVDGVDTTHIDNVQHIVFNADEAAFALGYLAAAWAVAKDSADPAVGVVLGMDIPPVRLISNGFEYGVNYFNSRKGRTVRCELSDAGTFNDTTLGGTLAAAQFQKGVEVVFPVAGQTGLGCLSAAVAAGRWAVGVDEDQYDSYPYARSVLLSSCIKRLDLRVHAAAEAFVTGAFVPGIVSHGTLANGGVALAPYHDFDAQISPALRAELTAVIAGINNGTLHTR